MKEGRFALCRCKCRMYKSFEILQIHSKMAVAPRKMKCSIKKKEFMHRIAKIKPPLNGNRPCMINSLLAKDNAGPLGASKLQKILQKVPNSNEKETNRKIEN